MHTLALLREAMLPQVLVTGNASGNPSDYAGEYSARGTVMTNEDRSKYSVWTINRDGESLQVTLRIPALSGRKLKAQLGSIDAESDTVNNYDSQIIAGPNRQSVELAFDDKGVAHYTVAPNSVSALTIASPAK